MADVRDDTSVIPPFVNDKNKYLSTREKRIVTAEVNESNTILSYVPMCVEDSYHFIDTVFAVKSAVYNLPCSMTLGRFRYLISQMSESTQTKYLFSLDPLSDCTIDDQAQALENLDFDMYNCFNHKMIHCIGLSGTEVSHLKIDPCYTICKHEDKHVIFKSPYGLFQLTYRIFLPRYVRDETTREMLHRQIAVNNSSLSVRSMLLLTDPSFPLSIVPGVRDINMLVFLSEHAPDLSDT